MKIISTCQLCEEHSLHVVGEEEMRTMQCINCGYASSDRFVGKPEENQSYKDLTDDMKLWVKETDGRFWIPSIMTLPFGMLYPFDDNGKMRWAYAKMIDIPEDKRKDYPDENGGFFTRMYDTENAQTYDEFLYAMADVNEDAKKFNVEPEKIKLPKLKKVNLVKT